MGIFMFVLPEVRAQAPPAPPEGPSPRAGEARAEPVVPPEPLSTPLSYPEGESESAVVVLSLTIDKAGLVVEVHALSGPAPFDGEAVAAARGWRFEPARRHGEPVASRIRYTLRFEPPTAPAPAPAAEPARSTPGPEKVTPPGSSAPQAPIEILVAGERPPPGSVSMTPEEARMLPGAFGDPLRAIEAEPGVVPIVSGLPIFFIRGAPPANVGFFIDGIEVPLLYHAFFGPSVIHPRSIADVELYRGASPVEYGRFAGPIVAVTARPLARRFTGEATLRAIDVGAVLDAPLGASCGSDQEACPGGVRVAGRYSYAGYVLSLLSEAELEYWDYQGEVNYDLGPHDQVSLLSFGAFDYFRSPGNAGRSGGRVNFHRADVRWDHRLGQDARLRTAVTGGYDHTSGANSDASAVSNKSLRARLELDAGVAEGARVRAGIDGRVERYGLETNPLYLSFPDYSVLFPERTETMAGAYLSSDLEPSRGIRVTPGVRADIYSAEGVQKVGVDPRVLAAFEVSERVTLEHSLGISHQRPNFAAQIPGAQVSDLRGGLQEAILWSSGVRTRLPWDLKGALSVFRTAYFHALDPLGGARDFTIDRTVLDRRATVAAAGVELSISRPLSRKLGGFLSYTLSRTTLSGPNGKSVSGFDRPHVLQAALSYDFGDQLRAGARAVLYSGVPELNLEGTSSFSDERRGTPYFRMDARVEKRFRLGEDAWWSLVGEVLNATSTREVVRLDCGRLCAERVAGPVILPSVGVEAGF